MQKTKKRKGKATPFEWVIDVFLESFAFILRAIEVVAISLFLIVGALAGLYLIYTYVKPAMLTGSVITLYVILLIFLVGVFKKYV